MAQNLVCDACGAAISDRNNRATVLIYTPTAMADPQLDICGTCLATFADNPKLKKAKAAAQRRILERQATDMRMTTTEYEEYLTESSKGVPVIDD